MYQFRLRMLSACLLLTCIACSSDDPEREQVAVVEPLPAVERFQWFDQPVVFSPPPGSWLRQPWQQGGKQGVSFELRQSPPGRIMVAEYYLLHRGHERMAIDGKRRQRFEPPGPLFTVYDVADRVRFDPRSLPPYATLEGPEETLLDVAGREAIEVRYRWNDKRVWHEVREIYVVADERLFVLTCTGSEKELELFERILATLSFPTREERS